jgi:hypothetical protein
MARTQQKEEIPAITIRGTKKFEGTIPKDISDAALDPKNPSNQKAQEGASGSWGRKAAKLSGGRSPNTDGTGKYTTRDGQSVFRAGKTQHRRRGGTSSTPSEE